MEFIAGMRKHVQRNLETALEQLSTCPMLRVQPPDGGYYLFPEVLCWDDEEALALHCLQHGVLVHPGYFYGYERGTHIMLSCLTEPTELQRGIDRLITALDAAPSLGLTAP